MHGLSRRQFVTGSAAALASSAIAMKPPHSLLKPGDRIAAIAPAGRMEPETILALLDNLRQLGLDPVLGAHAKDRSDFFAGTDEDRAADFNAALRDPSIRAISCLRGGWGCARILPLLEWEAWRADPKPVIGFSDITALLNAGFLHRVPLGFHGSQAPPPEKPFSMNSWRKALLETGAYDLLSSSGEPTQTEWVAKPERPVRGKLVGGNLMVLNQLIGTGYLPSFRNRILFLEDVNEAPYRLDRMLTQMHMAGVFRGVRAVLLGQFTKCDDPDQTDVPTALAVLETQFRKLHVPILKNLPCGHVPLQLLLPVGGEVELRAGTVPELIWRR